MGAWADITHETPEIANRVQGYAEALLTDREARRFDNLEVDEVRVEAAKETVQRKLLDSTLSSELDRFSSPEEFLDDLAGDTDLVGMLYEAIALAFIENISEEGQMSQNGRLARKANRFEEKLDEQIRSIANSAPYVRGWAARSGVWSGGSAQTTFDRYD